jgi:hypothetical protein
MPDIDSQPWPDRESVDIEQYVRTWREHHGIGSVTLITARGYFSVRELCHRFSPHFRLESWKGVGVAVPPSYMEPWAQRFPKVLNLAAYVDQWLGPCPLMRAMSDHVLMTFEHSRA